MRSFKRTLRGLGNQHLFYNVDLIVFLEGGSVSYNKADVYAGNFTAETEDIIFWRNIFNKFSNNKQVNIKHKKGLKPLFYYKIDEKIYFEKMKRNLICLLIFSLPNELHPFQNDKSTFLQKM